MTIDVFNGIIEEKINIEISTIELNISNNNVILNFNSVTDAETAYDRLSVYEYTDTYFECYFKPHFSQGVYVDNLQLELTGSKIICRGDKVRCA